MPIPVRWTAVVLGTLSATTGAVASQQPTQAQVEAKTSGLISILASPGTLAGNVPEPATIRERELVTPETVRARGDVLPRLLLFVQYNIGAPPAPSVVDISAATVASLVTNDNVRAVEVHRPPSFQLEDVRPFNRVARRTHHVEEFIAKYPGFTGATRVAAVVDVGAVRGTHREFAASGGGSRVRLETTSNTDRHSTHVAGTIIAAGVDERARGMAPAASVISIDFVSDLEKLRKLPVSTVHVTNHSYGPRSGWDFSHEYGWLWWGDRRLSELEDARFGKYTARESEFDELLADPTRAGWLAFVAAGNDRNDGPLTQPVKHYAYNVVGDRLEWEVSEQRRSRDGDDDGGVDSISGFCVSKNVVCVGAIHDAPSGGPLATTDFTAWGPADDGRIKPDLTANGQNLLSTSDANDQAYLEMPGTSMASPTAAGIGLIIGQAFIKYRGRSALGAELKAVLIHSATDAGRPGPDVEFGWGAIDALAAGDLVASKATLIEAVDIQQGPGLTRTLRSMNQPIRATLVWNDPAGDANQQGLDDGTPALQNDLDLQLVDPTGGVHHPYRLDRSRPRASARRDGVNRVDNVEVIDALPLAGAWQLRICAHALRVGTTQRAALVISGLQP